MKNKEICPECGRPKAKTAGDAASGMCPKWWATMDQAAEDDCEAFATHIKPNRPGWDEYFMNQAHLAATRSTCNRRQVGAVIVQDNMVVATGYNGAPKGIKHCLGGVCIREAKGIPSGQQHEICAAVHAEQNAVIQCARTGNSTVGATLYTTTYPCYICAKMIVNAGITEIVYMGDYPDHSAKDLFRKVELWVRKV